MSIMSSTTIPPSRPLTNIKYTREQKIVAAVWLHEKVFSGLTLSDITMNFALRFNIEPPSSSTIGHWEKKLFSMGRLQKNKKQRSLPRLMHVPYVKDSFRKFPELSICARGDFLGISKNTLYVIIAKDIMPEEIEKLREKGRNPIMKAGKREASESVEGVINVENNKSKKNSSYEEEELNSKGRPKLNSLSENIVDHNYC